MTPEQLIEECEAVLPAHEWSQFAHLDPASSPR